MKKINKEYFIEVCNNAVSMAEASRMLNLHFNTFKKYALLFGCYKTNQSGKGIKKKESKRKINTQDILNGLFPNYHTYKLRNRLLKEGIKEYKCEICGNTMWNNKPIPLELHHIDGNRFNHKLDNLLMICPNCHAQTETYRSKNIKP